MAFKFSFTDASHVDSSHLVVTSRQFPSIGCVALSGLLALVSVGCGQKEVASTATPTAVSQLMPSGSAADAEAVVSQFLDRIRRGGDPNEAMSLLTDRAQSELKRVGQVVQPIGSPDARFKVTRSTPMPINPAAGVDQSSGRLVHCIWSEPNAEDASATPPSYQVVWSVVMQSGEYKISGLILEIDENEAPLLLDFENGDLMAQVLGGQPAARTAQNPEAASPESAR